MFTAKQLTTASLALLAVGSTAVLVEPRGTAAANAQPAEVISTAPYPADVANPLDPPRVVGARTAFGTPTAGGPGNGDPA